MPNESGPGGTPGESPSATGETPEPGTSATEDASREGERQPEANADRREDDGGLRRALESERESRRRAEREAKTLRDEIAKRDDAGKSDVERLTGIAAREKERADAAEARVAKFERDTLAREIATEAGVPEWWDTLTGDDARSLRASANKVRERLGAGRGSLDGGVRGLGGPPTPESMDDLIRAGARRRSS